MKEITGRPQFTFTRFLKLLVSPFLYALYYIVRLAEIIDSHFHDSEDTWQMRVAFYGFYLLVVPAFIIISCWLFL